jgi:purine-binding chemotaxis protein CheW
VRNSPSSNDNIDYGKEAANQYVVFLLDGQRYALLLPIVLHIVRAVEITRLPEAPAIVLGAINVGGEILPVFNLRRRFLLPEREVGPNDQFLIASIGQRRVALVIDEAQGVIERERIEIITSDAVVPGLEHISGMVKLDDGLVLIHDLKVFLSPDEARSLEKSMEKLK